MARASRVALIEREVRCQLGGAALGLLLSRAEVIAEGRRADGPTAQGAFFGTTMITIRLDRLTDLIRDPITPETTAHLADLLRADRGALDRLRKLAHKEARRLDPAAGRIRTEVRVRTDGTTLYVDIEMEGPPA